MIRAAPTKKGTGLELFGHAEDLENLHETIHFLCGGSEGALDQHEHALSIAYEIRKAFERQREVRNTESGQQFGTQFVWPHIIFYVSYFRQLAAYRPTNKEHQSNLARLEFCLESSLLEYDPKVGAEVISLYPAVGAVTPDFYSGYVSDITYSFVWGRLGKDEISPPSRPGEVYGSIFVRVSGLRSNNRARSKEARLFSTSVAGFERMARNRVVTSNKAFQTDKVAVSHFLLGQKLRHGNFAPEQRR